MRKLSIIVIGIGAVLTFIVIVMVQVGHVTARSEITQQLAGFSQFAAVHSAAFNQDSLDNVVAVLQSDSPSADANYFPGGFGYGLNSQFRGSSPNRTNGSTRTLCSVNWMHGSGPMTWQGFVSIDQSDCAADAPITSLMLALDSGSTQTLTVGDLIEAFGVPIAAERPSLRSCFPFARFRYNANTAGASASSVNVYVSRPNLSAPGLQLYFQNGLSAIVPCYAGAQTTLNLESPVRAVMYTAPVPALSSPPFSYPSAQWHGLAIPSRYYAMCSASDDPRCRGRRPGAGAQNGFYNLFPVPSVPPIFPTFVPPGP